MSNRTQIEEDFSIDQVESPEVQDTWLVSYGDLMTILLVFFVLLVSASRISSVEFQKIKNAFHGPDSDEQTISQIYDKLLLTAEEHHLSESLDIKSFDDSLTITLPGQLLFELGQTHLKNDGDEVLSEFANVLNELPSFARIAIEGHTDDNPVAITGKEYTSNWHLSVLRALAVLEKLSSSGVCKSQCELRGFGEFQPALANRDSSGQPIMENQAANRRVVIRVYPHQTN